MIVRGSVAVCYGLYSVLVLIFLYRHLPSRGQKLQAYILMFLQQAGISACLMLAGAPMPVQVAVHSLGWLCAMACFLSSPSVYDITLFAALGTLPPLCCVGIVQGFNLGPNLQYLVILLTLPVCVAVWFYLTQNVSLADVSRAMRRTRLYTAPLRNLSVITAWLLILGASAGLSSKALHATPVFCTLFYVLILLVIFFGINYIAWHYNSATALQRGDTLEHQLDRQVAHYRSYQRYIASLAEYRDEYKAMMVRVGELLDENDHDGVRRQLASINDRFASCLQIHNQYSNNPLLDAILQDVSNRCTDEGIRFCARVYIPDGIEPQREQLCDLAFWMERGSMALCQALPKDHLRSLSLQTAVKHGWASITMEVSAPDEVLSGDDTHPLLADLQHALADAELLARCSDGMATLQRVSGRNTVQMHIHFRCPQTSVPAGPAPSARTRVAEASRSSLSSFSSL